MTHPTSYVLEVAETHRETPDALTVVFDVPPALAETFAHRPGQFLTVAVPSAEQGVAARNYTVSSPPHEGRLTITVKRTEGGYASHWINDHARAGVRLRLLPPAGIFTPKDWDVDLLLFAGGSGITPIHAIGATMLEQHSGRVVLLYANRDEESVIFADRWRALAARHGDRLTLVHWLESVHGRPTPEQIAGFAEPYADHDAFVCGPPPFMRMVTGALKELGLPRERRHQEKFVSLGGNPFGDVVYED